MTTTNVYEVNGIQINTLGTGSKEDALIFVHGNSCNAEMWMAQMQDSALTEKYQLVAMDMPGCGQSGRIDDYIMKNLASFIPGLAAAMGVKSYMLIGISYGTCLIGEVAPNLPGCKGIMLVSPNITNNDLNPSKWLIPFPEAVAMASPMVDDATLQLFASKFFNVQNQTLINQFIDSYKTTDPAFRVAVGKTIMENGWTDEPGNIKVMQVPVCIVFGTEEKVLQTNYLDGYAPKWQDKVWHIDGAAHFVNMEQPNRFNLLLLDFGSTVFKR